MGTMLGDFGLRVIREPPAAFGGCPPLQGGECNVPLAKGDGREAAGGRSQTAATVILLISLCFVVRDLRSCYTIRKSAIYGQGP